MALCVLTGVGRGQVALMAQVLLPGEQLGPDGGPGDAGGGGDFETSGAPAPADDVRAQKRRQQDGRARARARNERRAVLHAVQKQASDLTGGVGEGGRGGVRGS